MDSPPGQKTPHILILDDDASHRELCFRAFRDDPELFRVTIAGSLPEARRVIGQDPPDLIIADWILPEGKGIEILPRTDGMVTVPLIIMTSFGDERLAVEIMKSGAIDYVVKSATMFRDLPHIARRALRDWENIHERHRAELEVRESQKRLADILGVLPDAVLAIDNDGRVIAWNEAISRMTGVAAAEMLGKGDHEYSIPFYGIRRPILIDLVLTEDAEIEKKYDFIQREDGRMTTETFIPTLYGGKGAYLWGTASPLFDSGGRRIGAIEVIRDITDRKQNEALLLRRERVLETLLNAPNDTIALLDRQGILVGSNSEGARRLGLTSDEIIGKRVYDLLPPEIVALRKGYTDRVFETGEPAIFDDVRQGMILHNEIFPIFNPDHTAVDHVAVFARDITDQKNAELALKESEERYRSVVENAGEGIAVAQDGILQYANSRMFEMIQAGPEEMATSQFTEYIHPEDRSLVFDRFQRRVAGENVPRHYDFRILGKKGKITWVQLSAVRIAWNGRPATLNFLTDITDRKVSEENLAESEERYRSLLFGSGIGVGYWSPDGTLLFLNEISLARLKGKKEDFIGRTMQELFGENAGLYLDRLGMAVLSADPMEYEDYVHLPIGDAWYLSVYSRISGTDGTVRGIQVISMDITERKQAEEIRDAYESRLDTAMEIGSLAWWEMDLPEGNVRFDDRKASMLGYSPDKFRHYTDFTALLHPDDFEPAMQAMRDHLEGRDARYHIDYRLRTAGGNYRWFRDVGGITRRRPDGSPGTVTGIVLDITAAKEAEEALHATETRFRALIQNSSDIIRILDREGRIVYESPSVERVLGYSPGFLIGRNAMEFIHPDDLEKVKKDFLDVLEKTSPGIPTEFRIRKADGTYIWVDSIGSNLLEVPGVNGIVITTRPIQQRKEAEAARIESEERLRLAMEGADVASWDWNLVTGRAVFSDRFYTMLDYKPGEFPATYDGWTAHIHPYDRERVLPDLQKQIAEKRPLCEIEYRMLTKDGNWLWILGRGKLADFDEKGNPTRMIGVNIDITSRRLMESEIRSLNTVLEQRVRDRTEDLSKANAALEQENAQRVTAEKKLQASYDEKVMLLKEIHHRVKNNLQIIASLLNLQSRYIRDESTLAAIRESQNRVKAMALVHEKLYRSEDIAHISLHDYIRFLGTGLFQFYDAKARGIQFTLEIHDINVDIDAAIPLGLILNELISNSLKYAFPEGRNGEIAISVNKEGHTMTVVFRDTGIGIPADLDWKNTPSLGLRLVNTLVDQMNGTVELDRSSGTQFTMVVHEKEQREIP
jgi:PAS domain S-box-containing protein